MIIERKRFANVAAFLMALALLGFCGQVRAEFLAEGVTMVPLTSDGKCTAVAWAPHGSRVAFTRKMSDTQRQLFVMNADGTGEEAASPIGHLKSIEWSWRGDKLAYEFSNSSSDESQGGVFVYDAVTKQTRPISGPYLNDDMREYNGPYWSPDDRYVSYEVRPNLTRKAQMWIAEADTGKNWQLLPQRGQGSEARWNPVAPPRLTFMVEASGDGFDVATTTPDGRDFAQLTDIGAESIDCDDPRWSPTGEWVAFLSNVDMTQSERAIRWPDRMDCWIGRPDGSESKNLTNASSPSTQEQLGLEEIVWSWDGRWILANGDRFDEQGYPVPTTYLIDPEAGGYKALFTSDPRETGEVDFFRAVKWSYDCAKMALLVKRTKVKNWGADTQFEQARRVLSIYDVKTETQEVVLKYDEQLDRKRILGMAARRVVEDLTWSPDNRSLLLTISNIISDGERIYENDVYRVDLPERFIGPEAARHNGPTIGRAFASAPILVRSASAAPSAPTSTLASAVVAAPQVAPPAAVEAAPFAQTGMVTEIITPQHVTLDKALAALPDIYTAYITRNPARNAFLFKGPADVLAELRADLELVDVLPVHILVDMMAVELTDEANRNLGLDWSYAEGRFGFFQGIAGEAIYQGVGKLPKEFLVRLKTLIADGEGTILANPRTVAMNGQESLIEIRKVVNFFFNEGFDTSGRPVVKKSDISAVTDGKITPTLLPDGRIHLVVAVSVGTFTFSPDEGLPEQTTRKSETEVTVREGESIVIGGLRQQEVSRAVSKTPILGYIPYLRPLFTHTESSIQNSVLTIFITPRVMDEDEPAPEWPKLDGGDHEIVPIMEETFRGGDKVSLTGKSLKEERRKGGWLRRSFSYLGL